MEPEISGVAAVVLGSFNPQGFQPHWFAANDLMPKDEADGAEIDVIIPDVASFNAGPLNLNVARTRFHVGTTSATSFDVVRDLAYGTFELLNHSPVSAIGLNRQFHFKMPDEEAWHATGFRLIPRENFDAVLDPPGMEHLRMQGSRPDSDRPGLVRITIQPSARVTNGVYVEVNDHFDLAGDDDGARMVNMLDLLRDEWEISMERSEKTAKYVVEGP